MHSSMATTPTEYDLRTHTPDAVAIDDSAAEADSAQAMTRVIIQSCRLSGDTDFRYGWVPGLKQLTVAGDI